MALTKFMRHLQAIFIDSTPTADSPTWAQVGYATSFTISMNPQTTTEQYIKDASATTTTDSYQVSSSVPLTANVGDPAFDYVYDMFWKRKIGSDCDTHALIVDIVGDAPYKAQYSDATISIQDFGGDAGTQMVLNFDLAFNGDPTLGTATITDGVPVFTKDSE